MKTESSGGRPPTKFTDEDHQGFSRQFAVVFTNYGIALVVNVVTREQSTFTQFRKRFGVRGDRFLSGQPPTYLSWDHFRQVHATDHDAYHKARQAERAAVDLPTKSPYRRKGEHQ